MAFPVRSAQTHAAIAGVATDFHVSVYADRVLVVDPRTSAWASRGSSGVLWSRSSISPATRSPLDGPCTDGKGPSQDQPAFISPAASGGSSATRHDAAHTMARTIARAVRAARTAKLRCAGAASRDWRRKALRAVSQLDVNMTT